MDNTSGMATGLAGRYATALFDLARDGKQIDQVSASLAKLRSALVESDDFKVLTTSPMLSREQAGKAVLATADSIGLDSITRNFLGVLASNRRLGALPQIIRAFDAFAAHHRGEITAEVTSAQPLTETQTTQLKERLKAGLKRDVAIDLHVDPALLGGLVVKVGSRQIDSSIRTKLNSLAYAMKG